MIFIVSFLGVLIFGAIFISYLVSAPGYVGEKMDNFDGSKFINRSDYEEQGLLDLLKWGLTRKTGPWTELTEADVEYGEKPKDQSTQNYYVNHSLFNTNE